VSQLLPSYAAAVVEKGRENKGKTMHNASIAAPLVSKKIQIDIKQSAL